MKGSKVCCNRGARYLVIAGCVVAVHGAVIQTRADDWREVNENVRDQIAMLQPSLGTHNIEIDNRGRGEIALDGYVQSEEMRRRVQEAAEKAEGVSSVENRLKVASSGESPRDPEVAELQEAFRREVPHGRYNVAVNTHPGKVVLRGNVDSRETKEKLLAVASSVSKRKVVDELSVAPPKTDADIEDAIRRALAKEYPQLVKSLEVDVKDGVAVLRGGAASHRDVDKVLAMILNVEGVRDVESQVIVKGRDYTRKHESKEAME